MTRRVKKQKPRTINPRDVLKRVRKPVPKPTVAHGEGKKPGKKGIKEELRKILEDETGGS
ncbi:MAG: hypothetical protein V3W31_01175 [Thermodesulfobacteriota bacterium]